MSRCVIFGLSRPLTFALDDFHAAVELVRHDVPIMKECIFLRNPMSTNAALRPSSRLRTLPLKMLADEAFLGGALDVEFLKLAVFRPATRSFERLGVDDDLLVDFLFGPDEPLNFFTRFEAADLMDSTSPLGCSLIGTGANFFLLHFRRRF